jgi:Flp pilus assembly CpaE family ATPase
LHILGSAPAELPPEPRAEECTAVLDRAQSLYAATFVDLPGAMEPYELTALKRATEIFLVITTDMTGLHMAKRKCEALRAVQLADKVSILISHGDGRATLSVTEIEKLLQMPVRFILPKDEKAVARAVLDGASVQANSKLGAQIEAIAKSIAGPAKPLQARSARRFLEFCYVSPDADRYRWRD